MKFVLKKDILSKLEVDGLVITWIEAGSYPVIRFFDNTRILIDCGYPNKRKLTVVNIAKGKLVKG